MSASTDSAGPGFSGTDNARKDRAGAVQPPVGLDDPPILIVANRGLLLTAVMTAMVMTMLDTTIANVALPHMQASLGATQETISWVLTSYVLASAVALPLSGWLVDRVGIRRVLILSVIAFTAASVLCGLAQNLTQMVIFRVLQGLAGAFINPIVQTVMLDTSTVRERARMMTIFTQGIMIGPIAGPVFGGYLTENFDWRWVFFVNVPVGILCVIALLASMPHTPTRKRKFDLMGWTFVALAVSCLQLMLDRGPSKDWFGSPEIFIYAVVSLCGFWLAAVHLATTRSPLFSLQLFRDRNYLAGATYYFIIGTVMMSTMALLPILLQSVYGYPAIDAGWLLTPRGFGMVASATLFGRYVERFDPRVMLAAGFAISGYSLWMMTGWAPSMPVGPIIVSGFLQGVGLSLTFIPLNLIAFATLDPKLRTEGASFANLFRNLGASIGIAVSTVMLSHNLQLNHTEIGARITHTSIPFDLDRITAYGGTGEAALRVVDLMINQQAAMIAYLNDFLAMAVLCFLAIPVLFFVKLPKRTAEPGALPDDAVAMH